MVNIKILKFEIAEVLKELSEGKKIYRINLDGMTVSELSEKSVRVIMRDEEKWPGKYVYFIEEKEEGTEEKGTNAEFFFTNKPVYTCMASNLECTNCSPGPCIHRAMLFREVKND